MKPAPPGLLPMQLQPGDRLTDETGDREVIVAPADIVRLASYTVRP